MARRKRINRKYKDTLFRLLFGNNRDELLKLYNAVNDTDYTDPNELTINTLEDAIYVGMRNDVSFVFQSDLNLYEHQSTRCPNLPLRNLFYVSDLLQDMTAELNLYGSKRLTIPTPRFIVFYNGTDDLGGVREYRLSEMFFNKEDEPQLELVVRIIDINEGQDNNVLKNCKTLQEYSVFVGLIRDYHRTMRMRKAIIKAVNECISRGILKEFLQKHRTRMIMMSILYEYDAKKQRRLDREEGREEGRVKERVVLIQKKIQKGKTLDIIADELESSVEDIKPLYDLVIKFPADTDPTEIAEHLVITED